MVSGLGFNVHLEQLYVIVQDAVAPPVAFEEHVNHSVGAAVDAGVGARGVLRCGKQALGGWGCAVRKC